MKPGRVASPSQNSMVTTAAASAVKVSLAHGLASARGCGATASFRVDALAAAADHVKDQRVESRLAALAGGKHSSVHDKHACYMGDCTKSLLDARDVAVSDLHDPLQDADDALTWSARSSRGFNLRS